ncbi:MAG: VWA domain-containing protein [Deltaproteobacteria bacterium]|nr:VWA domain-containing protein [Deltaproteobacteria bacterium]
MSDLKKIYYKHRNWIEPVGFSLISLFILLAALLPSWISDGSSLRFKTPWFLLGLLAVPLIIFTGVRKTRTSGRMYHPLVKVLVKNKRGWKTWIPPLSVALKSLVIALVFIALARPQDSSRRMDVNVEGIDILLTLDLSGSMATPDMNPTRLGVAKDVLQNFIKHRKNDRIGSVVFAENAYTLCPLTLDYSILSQMISELELGVISDKATAIGNAVALSISRLRKSNAKSKAVILITDGTSNAGNTSPEQATEFAKTLGIKIYTILVGRNDNSAKINPALLSDMADKTGGAFFKASDKSQLESSFHNILDALEKSKIEDQAVAYAEVFIKYLWWALAFALIDLLLNLFVMRQTP